MKNFLVLLMKCLGFILVILLIASPITFWAGTRLEIKRIADLEGKRGSFAEVTKSIRTRYQPMTDREGLERARRKLGLSSVSNLFVVRFNGGGLPYFYGWVAYDEKKNQVVRSVVDQLW